MSDRNAFAVLRETGRIWAIGSIHGEADRLRALHQELTLLLQPDDRVVYLGNYLGYGPDVIGTVDEVLSFRRAFLARPTYVDINDFVLLRGSQEEMWQRVLQLQFAVDPMEVITWMAERGLPATLQAYAGHDVAGTLSRRSGPLTIAQWTGSVRNAMQAVPGHVAFMSALKRAAYTADEQLLFVNTGVDVQRPVKEQSDVFWWAGRSFTAINDSYGQYAKIIRGFDPDHGGYAETEFTITVDGGCGFDGALIAVCIERDGTVIERLEA